MQDRFKFRAVLKTDTHSIIAEPYYIFDNGYLVNIVDVQKPFEKKYPDDCFWEFLEEIEKQENCQEVSTDSEIIIFNSFDGLIQSTGLKDKNGKLIYENDIVKFKTELFGKPKQIIWDECHYILKDTFIILCDMKIKQFGLEVIGNIYENPELLGVENE